MQSLIFPSIPVRLLLQRVWLCREGLNQLPWSHKWQETSAESGHVHASGEIQSGSGEEEVWYEEEGAWTEEEGLRHWATNEGAEGRGEKYFYVLQRNNSGQCKKADSEKPSWTCLFAPKKNNRDHKKLTLILGNARR